MKGKTQTRANVLALILFGAVQLTMILYGLARGARHGAQVWGGLLAAVWADLFQGAALLIGQQVPLVRAHEWVHADVGPSVLLGEERGHVALVELGRTVQRHLRPHRAQMPSEARATQPVVGLLQVVAGRRVRPHHDVGVGAHAGKVVEAPDDHVLLLELADQVEAGQTIDLPGHGASAKDVGDGSFQTRSVLT